MVLVTRGRSTNDDIRGQSSESCQGGANVGMSDKVATDLGEASGGAVIGRDAVTGDGSLVDVKLVMDKETNYGHFYS